MHFILVIWIFLVLNFWRPAHWCLIRWRHSVKFKLLIWKITFVCRWRPANLRDSRYIWLPLTMDGPVDQPIDKSFKFPPWQRVSIHWQNRWKLPPGWDIPQRRRLLWMWAISPTVYYTWNLIYGQGSHFSDLVIKFLILISRLPESLAIRQHPRHTFPFICRQEARMGARYRLSRTNWLPLAIDVQLKQELVKICIRTAPWNTSIENCCCSSSTLHIVHYSFSTWTFFWSAVSSQRPLRGTLQVIHSELGFLLRIHCTFYHNGAIFDRISSHQGGMSFVATLIEGVKDS